MSPTNLLRKAKRRAACEALAALKNDERINVSNHDGFETKAHLVNLKGKLDDSIAGVKQIRPTPIASGSSCGLSPTDSKISESNYPFNSAGSHIEGSVEHCLAETLQYDNEHLEEGEIGPIPISICRDQNNYISVSRQKKKSCSFKSTSSGSLKSTKHTIDVNSAKLRPMLVHGRISLRKMKKAAQMNASKLGTTKNLAASATVGRKSGSNISQRDKSATTVSSSLGRSQKSNESRARKVG